MLIDKRLLDPSEELKYPVVVRPYSYNEMLVKEKVFTKDEVISMLTELQQEMEEDVLADDPNTLLPFLQARETCVAVIQQKINELGRKEIK